MTNRKELDELLDLLNRQRWERAKRTLQFYITSPGDSKGKRYQLMWEGTGSNVSPVMNAGEMELCLRLASKLED